MRNELLTQLRKLAEMFAENGKDYNSEKIHELIETGSVILGLSDHDFDVNGALYGLNVFYIPSKSINTYYI